MLHAYLLTGIHADRRTGQSYDLSLFCCFLTVQSLCKTYFFFCRLCLIEGMSCYYLFQGQSDCIHNYKTAKRRLAFSAPVFLSLFFSSKKKCVNHQKQRVDLKTTGDRKGHCSTLPLTNQLLYFFFTVQVRLRKVKQNADRLLLPWSVIPHI